MMQFGKQSSFAIEVQLIKNDQTTIASAYGTICYWVDSKILGDFRDPVFLQAVAGDLERVLSNRLSQRTLFVPVGDEKSIVVAAHEAMFGQSEEKGVHLPHSVFTSNAPPFTDVFGIIVDSEDCERIIWRWRRDGEIDCATLKVGEFENVIKEFLDWFADALAPPDVETLRQCALPDKKRKYWYSKTKGSGDYCVFHWQCDNLVFSHIVASERVRDVIPRKIQEHFEKIEN